MPLERMGKSVLALNKSLGSPAFKPEHVEAAREIASEGQLQEAVEEMLEKLGYRRLTASNCTTCEAPRGWYGHLYEPKRNPFLPDLIIFPEPNDRPALLLELKVVEDFRPGQKEMIDRGSWKLARSLMEAINILTEWENPK